MNATFGLLILTGVLVLWLWRSTRSENNVSGLGWGGGRHATPGRSSAVNAWNGPGVAADGGFSGGDGGGGCSAGDGGGSCG